MKSIKLVQAGITELETDAVVNAANEGLWQGSGVCGAIFAAAGAGDLQRACREIGGCETGGAVVTPAFALRAKYIIHAVGPVWMGGVNGEEQLLRKAYRSALALAEEKHCRSVAFPLISAGIFGMPQELAWTVALSACLDFQRENPKSETEIIFAIPSAETLHNGERILSDLCAGN